MGAVHTITGQSPGGYPTTCSFFVPVAEGVNPKAISIQMDRAQAITWHAAGTLEKMRREQEAQFSPLHHEQVPRLLGRIAENPGIRPSGRLVVGDKGPDPRLTAGSVWPIMRLAIISPEHQQDLLVILHELAHLGAVGDEDVISVLLNPQTMLPTSIRMLQSGWKRVVKAPTVRVNGKWDFDDGHFAHRGFYFEEAMAELIEMRFGLGVMDLPKAVVFRGDKFVFELPPEYGHAVAGWGALLLEQACPDVARLLMNGACGWVDYPALKTIVDARFPGLFEELYAVQHEEGLAKGTELILRRLRS